MTQFITIAYDLSAIDNHAYFLEGAPDRIFCKTCGCCIDSSYYPRELKTPNKADIGATYDRRFIVSLRFKEYIDSLKLSVDFLLVNEKKQLFFMQPQKVIKYSAQQQENLCGTCDQYYDSVVPIPSFYEETGKPLEHGIFFTSIGFGSGKEKSPSIILGLETALELKSAIKSLKFRGPDISEITSS
ncbi:MULTISPECIES: hypothetical protein [unclassified Pseudomonas]|uniref:hypothetical protein n=1 Tax=unclassified Pseudomonas TaxID=196821 RepID=UPI001F594C7E|nr:MULTISPECIES: hypothetical protein [unclassified Pseudomonas]